MPESPEQEEPDETEEVCEKIQELMNVVCSNNCLSKFRVERKFIVRINNYTYIANPVQIVCSENK